MFNSAAISERPGQVLGAIQVLIQAVILLVVAIVVALGGSVNEEVVLAVEGLQGAIFGLGAVLIVQPASRAAGEALLVENREQVLAEVHTYLSAAGE